MLDKTAREFKISVPLREHDCPGGDIIDRSYQLLALLDVCELAARYLDDLAPSLLPRYSGSLAVTMELAKCVASEVHDFVETGKEVAAKEEKAA